MHPVPLGQVLHLMRKKERRNRRASALNPEPRKTGSTRNHNTTRIIQAVLPAGDFLLQYLINNTLVNIVVFCAQRVIRRACTHLRPTYLHTLSNFDKTHTHELRAAPHNSGPSVKKIKIKTACPDSCCLSWRESGSQTWLRKSQKIWFIWLWVNSNTWRVTFGSCPSHLVPFDELAPLLQRFVDGHGFELQRMDSRLGPSHGEGLPARVANA